MNIHENKLFAIQAPYSLRLSFQETEEAVNSKEDNLKQNKLHAKNWVKRQKKKE